MQVLEEEILDVGHIEDFHAAPDLKGAPVPHEEVLENIKESAKFNIPVLEKQKERQGSFIFCAGGPSLNLFLDEIKKRKDAGGIICSSNHTHDHLLKHGIVSDICVVMDPKKIVATYIKNPQKETKYYIGSTCNPDVTKNLLDAGMDVTRVLIAYGMADESDIDLMKQIYPHIKSNAYLVGGTMTGLRAMNFAIILGFTKIEYYGMDSCFGSNPKIIKRGETGYEEAKARNKGNSYKDADTGEEYTINETDEGGFFYAFNKKRSENIQIAKTPDGRQYLTSPVFAHQAKQFVKWYERMEGKIEIILHGDNLTSNLVKCHKEAIAKATEKIGDKRWTGNYKEIQHEMHQKGNYGLWGSHDIEYVGRALLSLYVGLNLTGTTKILYPGRKISVLDYGCGSCNLEKAINSIFKIADVTNYDPFIEQYSKEPEGQFDVVTCYDVMEHVEIQCVPNTIKYIADKAKYIVLFSICCVDAKKTLPDGRNAHITQKSPQWWISEISKRLHVIEAVNVQDSILLACQKIDAKELLDKDKGGL